ncbi:hypothetical protein, partial [Brucella sp. NBRC 14130]|uniref:hypothetical protein n=1 Tax=Brucella sp. NBRC 14130 TaxID=3075483 RepID=UPI00333F138E
ASCFALVGRNLDHHRQFHNVFEIGNNVKGGVEQVLYAKGAHTSCCATLPLACSKDGDLSLSGEADISINGPQLRSCCRVSIRHVPAQREGGAHL